jgi:hypothetical protein
MKKKNGKKRHSGLDLLRCALGAAIPEQARKGALMPKYLAPLAGVNYETARQLLNGARHFESDSPLNRLMAENLTIATGVHPNFRKTKEAFIRDIWGQKYTPDTYRHWVKRGMGAGRIHTKPTPHLNGKPTRRGNPTFASEMKEQSKKLLATLHMAAHAKGPQFECMAFRLVKEALVRVSKDLGLLEVVGRTGNDLKDFLILVGVLKMPEEVLLPTFMFDSPWSATAPALSIESLDLQDKAFRQQLDRALQK